MGGALAGREGSEFYQNTYAYMNYQQLLKIWFSSRQNKLEKQTWGVIDGCISKYANPDIPIQPCVYDVSTPTLKYPYIHAYMMHTELF